MYLRAIGRGFAQMIAYFLVMNSKRCKIRNFLVERARFSRRNPEDSTQRTYFIRALKEIFNSPHPSSLFKNGDKGGDLTIFPGGRRVGAGVGRRPLGRGLSSSASSAMASPFSSSKARFRRRAFPEPNLIRIKADPNY